MKRTLDELELNGDYPQGSGVKGKKSSERSSDDSHDRDSGEGRTITVCTSSGGLATPYCPETAERTLRPGAHGPGRCRVHGVSKDRPRERESSSSSGASSSSNAPSEQSYTVCAKSGLRAGPSCAATVESNHAPSGTCRSCGRPRDSKPEAKPRPKPEPGKGETPKNSEG
jgi:hypothetical protein